MNNKNTISSKRRLNDGQRNGAQAPTLSNPVPMPKVKPAPKKPQK